MLGSGDIHYFVKVANIGYLAKIKIFLKFYDFKQYFLLIFTYVFNFKWNESLEEKLWIFLKKHYNTPFSSLKNIKLKVVCSGVMRRKKIKKWKNPQNSIKIAKNDRINAVNSIKAK